MSSFLSNIINRHSQNANFVRPRGVGVFETHRSWSEATTSIPEAHSADSQTFVSPSMDSVITPAVHENNSIKSIGNRSSKKQEPIDRVNKNKEHSKEQIIEKLNFKTKKPAAKITDSKNGDGDFKKMTTSEVVIDRLQNRMAVLKANNKFSNNHSGSVDKQMDMGAMDEQILTRPQKEIRQQLISKFNLKTSAPDEPRFHNKSDNASPVGNSIPTVKIHIGRIDIKAVKQNTQTVQNNRKASKKGMSLEQFLNKRSAKE